MKLYASWFAFVGSAKITFDYFGHRRASSLTRLAAVTREMREAIEARALA